MCGCIDCVGVGAYYMMCGVFMYNVFIVVLCVMVLTGCVVCY